VILNEHTAAEKRRTGENSNRRSFSRNQCATDIRLHFPGRDMVVIPDWAITDEDK
jgi:hypothetical protein